MENWVKILERLVGNDKGYRLPRRDGGTVKFLDRTKTLDQGLGHCGEY